MLKCIDCGVWLIQVQSPESSASSITLSTYLTALTHRPTLLSAHENYVEIEMSAEHLPLTWKKHSINSRSGNHHSVFKNGLLSFASEKSCWDLQHGSHIPVLRTDLQTQALIRLPISKSALASHSGGYLMSVLRAYSGLLYLAVLAKGDGTRYLPCYWLSYWVAERSVYSRKTYWMDSEKNTLKFQEWTNMVCQLEFQQWHFGSRGKLRLQVAPLEFCCLPSMAKTVIFNIE